MRKDLTPESNQPNAINLVEVLDAFEMMNEEFTACVNRKTGKMFPLHCDSFAGPKKLQSGSYGYSNEGMIAVAEEIGGSDDITQLPGSFKIHEWQIMKDFWRLSRNLFATL